MSLEVGDLVLIDMITSDGTPKQRPAILLCQMPPFNDWLIAGISSQVRQLVPEFDLLLNKEANYFDQTGLKAPGIIRLGYLATVSEQIILGKIGTLPRQALNILLRRLASKLEAEVVSQE
jgi:mRNA interferase MazF